MGYGQPRIQLQCQTKMFRKLSDHAPADSGYVPRAMSPPGADLFTTSHEVCRIVSKNVCRSLQWTSLVGANGQGLFHVVVATMSGIHYTLALPERALSEMRKRLVLPSAVEDDGMILSVLSMAVMEFGTEDRLAFEVYHKHIRLMIAARGSIENLNVPKWIQSTV